MLKGIKSFIPIGLAVCLTVLFSGISQSEIMGVDYPDHEYLYYDLSDDAIFIRNTTSDPDTIAEIEFSLYFDDRQVTPDGYMSIIQFKFTYDPDKAVLITDNWNKYNWDGDSSLSDQPYGDDRIVTVSLSNAQENYGAPTSFTHYVTLRFRALCMEETDNVPLEFSGTSWDNMVVMTDEDRYEPSPSDPDNTDDGLIEINDYTATFSIPETDLDCGALGKSVCVPVYAMTNFYAKWIYHAIWYDNNKLSFDSMIIGECLWTFPSAGESLNNDSVYVSLLQISMNYACQLDNEVLYRLWFTVLHPPGGDNWIGQTTVPDFDENKCLAHVWNCGDLLQPWQYINGDVNLNDYDYAEFELDYTWSATIPGVGSRSGDGGTFCGGKDRDTVMVRAKTDFPAGLAEENIMVQLDLGSCLKQPDVIEISGGIEVSADYNTYEFWNDQDEYFDDCDEWTDLFLLEVSYDNVASCNSTLSWTNRDVPLGFEDQGTGEIVDTTGTVAYACEDAEMTCTGATAEVTKAGEFSTTAGYSQSVFVSHELRIRNEFDLDTFSVVVTVPNDWCIRCIAPGSYVEGMKIHDYEYRLRSKSGFSVDANGDNYTTVATIYYGIPDDCQGTQYEETTPQLSEGLMLDDGDNGYAVFYVENLVRGRCDDGGGGCNDPTTAPMDCLKDKPMERSHDEDRLQKDPVLPTEFALHANRPNPFNPTTFIAYDVPKAAHVTIDVVNILGRRVATLVDEEKAPGRYETVWHGTDESGSRVASGIYLYRMHAGDFIQTKKMMLMK